MDQVLDQACRDTTFLEEGGLDGILVENFGDRPFFPDRVPPETVAAMAVLVREVVTCAKLPVGVNVLRNDAGAALSVAVAAGARFIRVNVHTGSMFTDQGFLEGRAHTTLRRRNALGASLPILADVMVKHATPPPGLTLESAARDTWFRGLADGLVLTGTETGRPVDLEVLRRLRASLPSDAKIWVGSGVTPETAAGTIQVADGIIVGSALQVEGTAGGGIDPRGVGRFMEALDRG
jgi:membrane complex biogenesis BtpA family protein